MTHEELVTILKATGLPVAYWSFKTNDKKNPPPKPPFITYKESFSSHFVADNKVYKKIPNIDIELYFVKKDKNLENILESLLDDNGLPYQDTEVFIESEKVFQKIYEIKLI